MAASCKVTIQHHHSTRMRHFRGSVFGSLNRSRNMMELGARRLLPRPLRNRRMVTFSGDYNERARANPEYNRSPARTGPGLAVRRPFNVPRAFRPGRSIYQCCDIVDDGPRKQDAAIAATTPPFPPAFLPAVRSSPQSDLLDYGRREQR